MLINLNGEAVSKESAYISVNHRAVQLADAVFEDVKIYKNRILFWEKHYFSLMTAMRIMRMPIPMHFNMDFLENEILKIHPNANSQAHMARLIISRKNENPSDEIQIDYAVIPLSEQELLYSFNEADYEVDIYKDFYINASLLSGIKTTAQPVRLLAKVFARENDYADCLLINDKKNVVDLAEGGLFLVFGDTLKTPPLTEGARDEVLRNVLIEKIKKSAHYKLEEVALSPFELQHADEMFSVHLSYGIRSVTKYRKKIYATETARFWLEVLNETLSELS